MCHLLTGFACGSVRCNLCDDDPRVRVLELVLGPEGWVLAQHVPEAKVAHGRARARPLELCQKVEYDGVRNDVADVVRRACIPAEGNADNPPGLVQCGPIQRNAIMTTVNEHEGVRVLDAFTIVRRSIRW